MKKKGGFVVRSHHPPPSSCWNLETLFLAIFSRLIGCNGNNTTKKGKMKKKQSKLSDLLRHE